MSTKAYKCPICGDVIYTSHDHGPPCDECGCGMKPDTSEARRVLFDKSQPKEARMAAMNVLQPKPAEARAPVGVTELPRDDETEDEYLIRRLSTLLAEIAVIVNGPEPALTSWGYADLPDLVRKLKDRVPPTRNVPDGATFEDYRDKLAVGELTPLDQMGFDNLLHDRLEATTTDAARVRDAVMDELIAAARGLADEQGYADYDEPDYEPEDGKHNRNAAKSRNKYQRAYWRLRAALAAVEGGGS